MGIISAVSSREGAGDNATIHSELFIQRQHRRDRHEKTDRARTVEMDQQREHDGAYDKGASVLMTIAAVVFGVLPL